MKIERVGLLQGPHRGKVEAAVLAAAALSLMAFAEECQEEKGYGSHKAGLLDVLGMPEEEKFGACLKRMLEI